LDDPIVGAEVGVEALRMLKDVVVHHRVEARSHLVEAKVYAIVDGLCGIWGRYKAFPEIIEK
jgi:hypothetical protein